MQRFLFIFFLLCSFTAFSQTHTIEGDIFNTEGEPLGAATAVLLNPADSTMEYFGISNRAGHFGIMYIKPGEYLMQIAFLGYRSIYRELEIPLSNGTYYGRVAMEPNPVDIDEVQVYGERIPIRIKRDTIEFNAAAFKTKPDAVVEDLLKKLPGFEVDRAGNIKALGENVVKVLVDGKEFFGNNPKVATQNLPADAIDKVQVYDKKSDESEFTGVSDGSRNRTVNLILDEDKKKGVFGNVIAGYGTDNHYLGGGKVYKFTDKNQIAVLGTQNNINQLGFSFSDYIDFSGGIQGMMSGGGSARIQIGSDGSFPINFGQPVSGLTTSGGGGANFSHSWSKDQRVFMSYLGNGSNKKLEQKTNTRNFTDIGSFFQEEDLNEVKRDTAHRINFGMRYMIDSSRNIILNGGLSLSSGYVNRGIITKSLNKDTLLNRLNSTTLDYSNQLSGNFSGSFLKKINPKRTIFKLSGDISYNKGLTEREFSNIADYFGPGLQVITSQYQDNLTNNLRASASTSITQKIGKQYYLVPQVRVGTNSELLKRTQGLPLEVETVIDSLSPEFKKTYQYLQPELSFKRNTDRSSFEFALKAEYGSLNTFMKEDPLSRKEYFYFTPWLSWDYEYQTGRRVNLSYRSAVNIPSVSQLMPVVNNINPLSLVYGNPDLKPEYNHSLFVHWFIFDQFSFTSLMVAVNSAYTKDKINWVRYIDDQFRQEMSLRNVDEDYRLGANITFGTPIRPLGITINTTLDEGWNQGLSIVNDVENVNTNFNHSLSLKIDNRKKKKWDWSSGASIRLTDAKYSIQESLNNRYFDWSYFADIRFTPNDHWNFQITADVTNYDASSFEQAVSIPLIGAEASYYFLKNKRGILTIQAFDMLDKNTGLSRMSELNYLKEQQSNIIGRYFLVTFKYMLNKIGGSSNSIDIKIDRHR